MGIRWDGRRTKVKHKMADGHQDNSCRGTLLVSHPVVNTSGDDEQNHEQKERGGQPLASGDAVRGEDKAGAAGNGR